MSSLFLEKLYVEAITVAYALPSLYTLAAYMAAGSTKLPRYLHFLTFAAIIVTYAVLLLSMGAKTPSPKEGWAPAFMRMAFIASVMSLMQYPKAGWPDYFRYRTPLFLGGVIFMLLFIYFAAMLPNVPHPPALDKIYLFPVGMAGFWLSAAWLVSRRVQGRHVSGLEIRPLMPFRPDFILPGGVTFVKGVIMMGVGLMIAIHPQLGMPKWNWWGFDLAFWGIISLIPLRGMYKLVKGRRRRMLGDRGAMGFKAELYKSLILFVGLQILLYGFVNAFFGTIPFKQLGLTEEFNAFYHNPSTGWLSIALLIIAFFVLVPLRSWYKVRLAEGLETFKQLFIKQLLLYVGTLTLILSYIHLLWLPPIRETGYAWFYPSTNPMGLTAGLSLFVLGSALILIFRPLALRNELNATLRTMAGVVADLPLPIREKIMERRINSLVQMSEEQRIKHVKLMVEGAQEIEPSKRDELMSIQMKLLAKMDEDSRSKMIRAMDKAIFGGF